MSLADKKGVWIWELAKLPRNYLELLKRSGVQRVFLKTYDGKSAGDGIWRFQATAVIVDSFKKAGIEVWAWGYHYGESVTEDFEAVKFAKAIGCVGYVLDVEQEFKAKSTHANLEALLERCTLEIRNPDFFLGFTSFGHCGFHSEIPWSLLYRFCDVSLPQIYYEKFGFGTDAQEIKECIESNKKFSGTTPIWPIFGSESDTVKPATVASLQESLNAHPSASIWRLPNAGERGHAFSLVYGKTSTPVPTPPTKPEVYIPTKPLSEELSFGREGEMVAELQKAVSSRGLKCAIDGSFGRETKEAVMMHQRLKNLDVDGVVGKFTWESLGGKWITAPVPSGNEKRLLMAAIAKEVALNHYELHSKDSFVWKEMVAPLVPAMKKLGHIGDAYLFVNWCSAYVTYVARRAGYIIPDIPPGFWASMALVEAYVFWAKQNGTWREKREFNPTKGTIWIADWDGDKIGDHIGIVDSYVPGQSTFVSIEGNKSNVSGVFTRNLSNVRGWIQL